MSVDNFRPRIYQRGACVLEIYARVCAENHYEILVKGNKAYVSPDTVLELINRYLDRRFFQVESVDVWLQSVYVDSVYIQDRLMLEHNVNVKVFVDESYTNGH